MLPASGSYVSSISCSGAWKSLCGACMQRQQGGASPRLSRGRAAWAGKAAEARHHSTTKELLSSDASQLPVDLPRPALIAALTAS